MGKWMSFLFFLQFVAAASLCSGQDGFSFTRIGHFGGAATAVDVQPPYFYYNQGADLIVYDLSARLELVRFPLPDAIRKMIVTSDRIYAACGNSGLVVVDIAQKNAPSVISTWRPGGLVDGLLVSLPYVFVVAANNAVHLVDLTVPTQPRLIRTILRDYYIESAAMDESHLYISDGLNGIFIYDLSSINSPRLVASISNIRFNGRLTASGGYLYDSLQNGGLIIYDVTNPVSPVELSMKTLPGRSYDLDLDGTTLYMCNGSGGVRIIDVADPQNPVIIGQYSSTALSGKLSGTKYFIAAGFSGTMVLDVARPRQPVLTLRFRTLGVPRSIYIKGSEAFIADFWNGLTALDITRPDEILVSRALDLTGDVTLGAAVGLTHVYVACGVAGLRIIDIRQAHQLKPSATDASHPCYAVALANPTTLIRACGDKGLDALDISNPIRPKLLSSLPLDGWVDQIIVHGRTVYAGNGGDLFVIDLSNPAHPILSDQIEQAGSDGFANQTHYLLTTGSGTVTIFDVLHPLRPSIISETPVLPPQYIHSLSAYGARAYLAARFSGLLTYNVADRKSPALVGTENAGADIGLVLYSNPNLYVGDARDGGLTVFGH